MLRNPTLSLTLPQPSIRGRTAAVIRLTVAGQHITPSASPVTPLSPRTARTPRSRACFRVVKPGFHHALVW